ncbi:MAG: BrnT family toxin [candidate division KSB1 bacterium]|nr:BrnT family toxin [candidate division KSB1 bacterium]MDZ7300916.1 BrnT family toxin [candidate division KSB1 bacterium]MDZ7314068.1 BrnT family toxin [candidate division KSB1 bacterium]
MKIVDVEIKPDTRQKLLWKHQVTEQEVRQALRNKPKIRFHQRGKIKDEHLYVALSRTEAGRYLTIFFIYKLTRVALVISARDMDSSERKTYAKK